MVAITSEPSGHSFASTRLYDSASGAPLTISFAIPVSDGLLTPEAAARIRESLANLIAAGFSVNAPGLEAGEERESVGAISRREKTDGTPILDLFAPSAALVYKLITIYLDTPEQIAAFETATGLTLKDIPLNEGDQAINRESKTAGRLLVDVKRQAMAILKPNPRFDPNEQETAKKKPARLFVGWEKVEAARPAPSMPVIVPKIENPDPKVAAVSPVIPQTGSGSGSAASTNGGWISPATWIKNREEWDTFLASALEKFQMDADAVDNALRRLSLCDKVGIGDWHKQRNWAIAALVAAYCKYNAELISAYTSGLPAKDAETNFKLDQLAKMLIEACPDDAADDPFAEAFGGDDPAGRKAIAAELENEMVVIDRIEKDMTSRGHDKWIGFATMDDSAEPLRITLFQNEVNAIRNAGYTVNWPKTSGQSIEVAIPVITYQNKTTGRRVKEVMSPTLALDDASA